MLYVNNISHFILFENTLCEFHIVFTRYTTLFLFTLDYIENL